MSLLAGPILIGVRLVAPRVDDLLEHLAHARAHQVALRGGEVVVAAAETGDLGRPELVGEVTGFGHGAIVAPVPGRRQGETRAVGGRVVGGRFAPVPVGVNGTGPPPGSMATPAPPGQGIGFVSTSVLRIGRMPDGR